jgi:DNA-binding response OmpR family regulator
MFKIYGENHTFGKSVFDITRDTTILIIEDDPLGSKLLESALKKEGYLIYCAASATEGMKKAVDILPDVILLDIVLPDINGFEVCRKLRADKLLADIVIVIITSLHDRDSHIKGIEAGADDFITKPFDSDDLKLKMRSIAKMNRYRRIIAERAKFEWVVERSEDGFLIVDDDDHIVYINPQGRLYLNLPMDKNELPEKKLLDIIVTQYNLEPKEAWIDWMKETPRSITRYFVRPETPMISSLWLEVECLEMPYNFDMGRIIKLEDVTAQKYSQARMRSFQSAIYHKLRTPMTSVLGSMEILSQHDKIDMSKQELKEYIDEALKNLRRLIVSTEDIFSHQDSLKLAEIGDSFSLEDMNAIISYMEDYLNLKSISLKNYIQNKNILIPLSQRAIEFIIIELLGNSIKFHPNNKPEILIELRADGKEQVAIRVIDNGRNIPPENLNKIWSPNFQIEKSFKENIAGMGLGLSSVATIIWGVGGSCNILNRIDKPGVVVEIILPVVK